MQTAKLIKQDEGRLNERLIQRYGEVDLSRIESASRIVTVSFSSPEAKRLFIRMFHIMQSNMHYISVIARLRLPTEDVEKCEQQVLDQMALVDTKINREMARANALFAKHKITELASYQVQPLPAQVPVYSRFGRRYLELLQKFDHLMLMLETMAMDELIGLSEQTAVKAGFKRAARSVAAAALSLRVHLHRRINPPQRPAGVARNVLDTAESSTVNARAASDIAELSSSGDDNAGNAPQSDETTAVVPAPIVTKRRVRTRTDYREVESADRAEDAAALPSGEDGTSAALHDTTSKYAGSDGAEAHAAPYEQQSADIGGDGVLAGHQP